MYSEFKSLQFTGVSDSQMFLSAKDLTAMELNFLVRPATVEFQDENCPTTARPAEDRELYQKQGKKDEEDEEQEDKRKVSVSSFKIKIPTSLGDDVGDGCKTPTSSDHKIPVVLRCPPAPRKPKSVPSTKRKAARRRILLDLSNEIESLFPPALLVDLGGKIKKVRQGSDGTK